MRVIFMGTPDFSVPALQAIADRHTVVAVYCQPPRPAGRGQKDRPSPVQTAAEALGLEVRTPTSLRTPEAQDAFAALQADIAVVAAYGLILPQPILDAPRLGCINIHASLLPRWRGAAPIHRAIMSGDAETGVTIMQMEAGLDTGPMLLKDQVVIGPTMTTGALHDILSQQGAALILPALDRLDAGTLTAIPQPEDGVTYAAKIDKAEARIDWTRPASEVARHINGLSPFPGAWFDLNGQRIKVVQAGVTEKGTPTGTGAAAPGTTGDDTLSVVCGDGAMVTLLVLQRSGKGAMPAIDFLRGTPVPKGTILA